MKDESQTHEPTGPSLPSDAERLDGKAHATIARLTGGLSPTALALAWTDWAMHLVGSPSKQLELQSKALEAMAHAAGNSVRGALARTWFMPGRASGSTPFHPPTGRCSTPSSSTGRSRKRA